MIFFFSKTQSQHTVKDSGTAVLGEVHATGDGASFKGAWAGPRSGSGPLGDKMLSRAGADGGEARLLPPGEMGRPGLLALERGTTVSLTLCPLGSSPSKGTREMAGCWKT
ncbi:unnamed protein product [Rangifer tarandus platyrhynchus]|uniref:Uncharacterized protein n=1 Tax=Rangifer tarandus platyrhynchus TaxID=3082113 RepID=A0AC59ZBC7_RANTA